MAFEFDGKKYAAASKHQKEWGSRLIDELHLHGGESVLDLGCGDGALTAQLSLAVGDGFVMGIDASAGMIAAAKEYESGNLRFEKMNIDDLCEHERFEVIYSNAALHWVKNHARLLDNTLAALKPGGRILWSFAGEGNCARFFEVIRAAILSERFGRYFTAFEWPWFMPALADYRGMAEQAGFVDVTVSEENADRYFADAEEMTRWIDQPSIVPFLSCVPDGEKRAFRDAVVEQMIRKTQESDGRCFETFRRIKIFARKPY